MTNGRSVFIPLDILLSLDALIGLKPRSFICVVFPLLVMEDGNYLAVLVRTFKDYADARCLISVLFYRDAPLPKIVIKVLHISLCRRTIGGTLLFFLSRRSLGTDERAFSGTVCWSASFCPSAIPVVAKLRIFVK